MQTTQQNWGLRMGERSANRVARAVIGLSPRESLLDDPRVNDPRGEHLATHPKGYTAVLIGFTLFALGACAGGQSGTESGLDDTLGGAGAASGGTPGAGGGGGSGNTSSAGSDSSGGTGPIGVAECVEDAECDYLAAGNAAPIWNDATLISARCGHLDPTNSPLPTCSCRILVTPSNGGESFETGIFPGLRGDDPLSSGCSEYGRPPSCAYCASEFPGCNLDSGEDTCTPICEQLLGEMRTSYQEPLDAQTRLARCTSEMTCETITEIGGQCYVGTPPADGVGYDCSLSDAELLALGTNEYSSSCEPFPTTSCAIAAECPRALGCVDGNCTGCGADQDCADAEICLGGFCLRDELVECTSAFDCTVGEDCVWSGIELTSGRGNELTRAFCQVDPRVGCDPDGGWSPACIP